MIIVRLWSFIIFLTYSPTASSDIENKSLICELDSCTQNDNTYVSNKFHSKVTRLRKLPQHDNRIRDKFWKRFKRLEDRIHSLEQPGI